MIEQEVIEKHPPNEPAQWVSNTVLAPKSDGSIRITLDARNVNKAMLANNHPIPRHEDIKASLANAKICGFINIASWKMRKGATSDGEKTPKPEEVTDFMKQHQVNLGLK